MTALRRRHWLATTALAAGLHVVAGVALFHTPASPGAQAAGQGGITVNLTAAGGTPAAAGQVAPEPAAQPAEVETADTARSPDTVADAGPRDTATAEPSEAVPSPPRDVAPTTPIATAPTATPVATAEPVLAAPADAMPVLAQATEAPPTATPTEPVPVPVEVAAVEAKPVETKPVEARPVETETPTAKPVDATPVAAEVKPVEAEATTVAAVPTPAPPVPRAKPAPPTPAEPAPVAMAPPAESKAETLAALSQAPGTSDSQGDAARAGNAGQGDTQAGGGMPGAPADYLARLQAWLERHKEYPRRARLRRQEGTALVYFVLDRAGRVTGFELRQTSGHSLLDKEAAEMVRRAQPLPPPPASMAQAGLELVVPVRFQLR